VYSSGMVVAFKSSLKLMDASSHAHKSAIQSSSSGTKSSLVIGRAGPGLEKRFVRRSTHFTEHSEEWCCFVAGFAVTLVVPGLICTNRRYPVVPAGTNFLFCLVPRHSVSGYFPVYIRHEAKPASMLQRFIEHQYPGRRCEHFCI